MNLYQKIVEVRKVSEGFSKDGSSYGYKTAKGKDVLDFVVKGEMSYTWINGDEPSEREVISWAYYGQQDDISKAYGSALTYSERYFLLKCLGLPTDEDDPDKPKENQEPIKHPYKTPTSVTTNSQSNTPAAQQKPPTSQPSASGVISAAQIKYAHTLKSKKKVSEDDFKRMVAEHGNESLSELTAKQAREFINFLTAIADPA